MNGAKALVVFDSWTGATKEVAHRIARLAAADIEALVDRRNHGGLGGYLRASLGTTLHLEPDLAPAKNDPLNYAIVIVGTPIWGTSISATVKTYLATNRLRLESVAFFCTHTGSGSGSAQALREMEAVCGIPPLVSLALRKPDIACGNYEAKARVFVGQVQRILAGDAPPPPSLPSRSLRSSTAVA